MGICTLVSCTWLPCTAYLACDLRAPSPHMARSANAHRQACAWPVFSHKCPLRWTCVLGSLCVVPSLTGACALLQREGLRANTYLVPLTHACVLCMDPWPRWLRFSAHPACLARIACVFGSCPQWRFSAHAPLACVVWVPSACTLDS